MSLMDAPSPVVSPVKQLHGLRKRAVGMHWLQYCLSSKDRQAAKQTAMV
jgi:hypothetical protein